MLRCECIVMPTRKQVRPAVRACQPMPDNCWALWQWFRLEMGPHQWSKTHPGFIHGSEDWISDQTCMFVKPGDIQQTKKLLTLLTSLHLGWNTHTARKCVGSILAGRTYFRWSSIMQLASSMAVGLAMFLSAILFPVFLVAWGIQKYRPKKRQKSWVPIYHTGIIHCCTNHKLSSTHRFKDSVGMTIIGPGDKARPSHKACAHIAHHVPIQIRHHHHIKLLRLGHQLKYHMKAEVGSSNISKKSLDASRCYQLSPAWWCCPQSCCQMWCLGNQRPLLCNTAGTSHHQASCWSGKFNTSSTKKVLCKTQEARPISGYIWSRITYMMLALWTAVTLRRPFSLANRKAYSAILRELFLVMILRLSTTPDTL